jgi:hypothetical protein
MPTGTWIYGSTERKYALSLLKDFILLIFLCICLFVSLYSDENAGKAAGHELKGAQALHHYARAWADKFPDVEMLFPLVALVGMYHSK